MYLQDLSLNTNLLNLGALLGTGGRQELIDSINARCGGASFFGTMQDPFRTGFQSFMTEVVKPFQQAGRILAKAANSLMNPDHYKPITTAKALKNIPPCMRLGILYYAPVRQQLEEERIDGWGVDPTTLEPTDIYEDALASDYVEIHSSLISGNEFTISHIENTDGPQLSCEEAEYLRATREFLDEFMHDTETEYYDVTAYPELHS